MTEEKRKTPEKTKLLSQESIRTIGKKRKLQVLTNIGSRSHQTEIKEKVRKLLETKLCSRYFIKRINTWAVLLVWYSGPFLKLITEELRQIDQRTRKLLTIHWALHSRDDKDWLYVSRKEGGSRLGSIQDGVVPECASISIGEPLSKIGTISVSHRQKGPLMITWVLRYCEYIIKW